MTSNNFLNYPNLLRYLDETGMTFDEAFDYLNKQFPSEKKEPDAETKRLFERCKQRGLL